MSGTSSRTGRLFGVGVGPGDPELLTLKAARIIEAADVVASFAKKGRASNARAVVADRLTGKCEITLSYPVTTELHRHDAAYRGAIGAFYEEAAAGIAALLDQGLDVAVLSEGDPLFYGSYMHLHCRLAARYTAEVVPGVTGMSGGWSQAGIAIAQGDDVTTILPGTLEENDLVTRLSMTDAAIIMKLGRNLPKVRRALAASGRIGEALYVERATTPASRILRLDEKADETAPYFSIVLVPGWRGTP